MDIEQFWNLIEQARGRVADSADAEDIAHQAAARRRPSAAVVEADGIAPCV
ncbi:hypothetical protein [Streptomyces sp. NPDC000880]